MPIIGEWQSLWIIQLGPAEAQEWATSVTKKIKKFGFVILELVVGSCENKIIFIFIFKFTSSPGRAATTCNTIWWTSLGTMQSPSTMITSAPFRIFLPSSVVYFKGFTLFLFRSRVHTRVLKHPRKCLQCFQKHA